MPPGTSSSTGGGLVGGLKKLPPWAWLLALAGGVIVGFILLKPGEAQAEGEEPASAGEGPARKGGGGGAPPPELLDALGLTETYIGPSYSDGWGGDGGDGGDGGGATSTGDRFLLPESYSLNQPGIGFVLPESYSLSGPSSSSLALPSSYTLNPSPSSPAPSSGETTQKTAPSGGFVAS